MPRSFTSSIRGSAGSPGPLTETHSPAHAASPDPRRVEALAAALFELRAAWEADLRALTSMQRSLERVRCDGTSAGERELLLGEITRLLDQADAAASATAVRRQQIGEHLAECRALRPAVTRELPAALVEVA